MRSLRSCAAGFVLAAAPVFGIQVEVRLQGAVPEPFTRDVVFIATDGEGVVLKEWAPRSLEFVNGAASDTLPDAPEGAAFLSAKTGFHLRVRVPLVEEEGSQKADLTGANSLPGGDLNGDNRIDARDFAILRFHWYTRNSDADITGDGETTAADFEVLKSNWNRIGHAP